MDTSVAGPSLFEVIKFVIEVVLIGGLGLAWKVFGDWQKQLLEQQKTQDDRTQRQWERLFANMKPALETQAEVAIRVADEYYRPVLDAICAVDLYAETYQTMEETIMAAQELIRTGRLPHDIRGMVRESLDPQRNKNPQSLIKAVQEALPNAAAYLCSQLNTLHKAIEKLINSGYMWELEGEVEREDLIRFFNIHLAAEIPDLVKNNSPEEVSKFLEEWRQELDPIRALRDKVPWDKFLASYYKKLREGLYVSNG